MRIMRSLLLGGIFCSSSSALLQRPLFLRGGGHANMAVQSISMAARSAMPTIETGVADLMESSGGEADGRGTLIGVFDTGCDLNAAGLLTTSDGKPKYVDFLDCTGGGDVDMSKKASRGDDGTVEGLSGRKLKLGDWANGVDEFRVGAVRLYSLLPASVRGRVGRERKARFTAAQHAATTEVQRELDGLEGGELSGSAKKDAKKDLELMQKELKGLMDSYQDAGPLLDVLLYQEAGGVWRAAVDKSGVGDLTDVKPMAPYRHAREAGDLGFGSELSYCVQV